MTGDAGKQDAKQRLQSGHPNGQTPDATARNFIGRNGGDPLAATTPLSDLGHSQYHSLSMAYQTYLRHDQKEQNHWDEVCRTFRQYANFAMAQWANHQYRIHALPEAQRNLLPNSLRIDTTEFQMRTIQFKEAAIRNQFCLDCILRHAGMQHSQQCLSEEKQTPPVSDSQFAKASSVLKSLARDWSLEGKPERDLAYQPILRQLKEHVPLQQNGVRRPPPRICVPGAGVGRLAFDLSALGYSVQGNDFSLFMLLASDFMLNGGIATPEHPILISPWLLETRNVHSPTDPLRIVQIPDVDPYSVLSSRINAGEEKRNDPEFSMAAGEFAAIYSQPRERGQWDAVVCSFFIDTAPSIVEYIQILYGMLKPGGFVINFGPLLYHWSGPAMSPADKTVETYRKRYEYLDDRYLDSVDLCWEDVRSIFQNVGFEVVEEHSGMHSLYTADRRSMMNMNYRCVNFVMRKPTWSPPSVEKRAETAYSSVPPKKSTSARGKSPKKSSNKKKAGS